MAVPSVVSTVTLSISAIMIGNPSPRGGTAADTRQFPASRTTIVSTLSSPKARSMDNRRRAVFESVVDRLATRQYGVVGGTALGAEVQPRADVGAALRQFGMGGDRQGERVSAVVHEASNSRADASSRHSLSRWFTRSPRGLR